MSGLDDRVLALAGLAQAVQQVRRLADTGEADQAILSTAVDSVFQIDADSPAAVYGGAANLRPGLMLLRDHFRNSVRDDSLPRLALAVLQLERRFSRDPMAQRVHAGLVGAGPTATRLGSAHPEVLAALGSLYAATVSHLRPRVLVQGNPHYLGQAQVVGEVRAVLLAALRSAVLWRQLGGSLWDFLLRRRAMLEAVEALLR